MGSFTKTGNLLRMPTRGGPGACRKAVTMTSAPDTIQPEEFEELLDLVVDRSKLWQIVKAAGGVIPMSSNQQIVRYIAPTNQNLRPAACGVARDDLSITATACMLNAVDVGLDFSICDNELAYNLEGEGLEAHILGIASKILAEELDILALMGNTDGSYSSPRVHQSTLALMDGWYKQLQDGHVLDAGDAPASDNGRALSWCKIMSMQAEMPDQYAEPADQLRIFMPRKMKLNWQSMLAARGTGLGDSVITGQAPSQAADVRLEVIPLLPTDLTSCSDGSFSGGTGTFMFEIDPANLKLGINTDITYERERNASLRSTKHIFTVRFAAKICVPDASVLYDCMEIADCSDIFCQPRQCAA